MIDDKLLPIGTVAENLNVSQRTIRFYESIGIIKTRRGAREKRFLNPDAIKRIEQVLYLQGLGLTLREIIDSLHSIKPDEVPKLNSEQIIDQLQFLRDRRSKIDGQIRELEGMLNDAQKNLLQK